MAQLPPAMLDSGTSCIMLPGEEMKAKWFEIWGKAAHADVWPPMHA